MTGPCVNCGATWHVWCDGGVGRAKKLAMTVETLSTLKFRIEQLSKDFYDMSVEIRALKERLDDLAETEGSHE